MNADLAELGKRLIERCVVHPGVCWEWRGSRNVKGYGLISLRRKNHMAHRVAWQLFRGPIPDGVLVCHHCDNPPCCNPEHLFLGSDKDNVQDAIRKGRWLTKERHHSAKLTQESVAEMRRLNREEGIGQKRLARMYQLSNSTVWEALNGVTWKD